MKNAARGIGGPATATVTTRAIVIAAPLIQVRPVVESVHLQLSKTADQIQLAELPPIMPDGAPRTRLIVHDHPRSGQPAGLAVSQELLRDIRDRAEGRLNGTFLAA